MNNWKYVSKFYKIKDSRWENPSRWVESDENYAMSALNKCEYVNFRKSLGNGIFLEDAFRVKPNSMMEVVELSKEEMDKINEEFARPLERMTEERFIECALYILNINPYLGSSTCMGWKDFDDETKNPNWMGGEYILPDNNEYLICLCKGRIRIYPGKGDPFCTWITKEPLIEFKINLNEWAERVTNEKSTIQITQLKNGDTPK
jgi:hypothetical protein